MIIHKFAAAVAFVGALAVTACGTSNDRAATTSTAYSGTGVVESVQIVDRKDPGLIGAIAGGVVGGALGHQIGGGRGQTAATVAGAVGGAVVGREIEKRARNNDQVYRVTVRMDNGSYQTVAMEDYPTFTVGDRVRLVNGTLIRY